MISYADEGRGLVKVTWDQVRHKVLKVNPQLTDIIDELNPGKSLPLYLAYYPYGTLTSDTQSPFIPLVEGGVYRLTDHDIPKEIDRDLGYGRHSSPMGLILDKISEVCINLSPQELPTPFLIYTPGTVFALGRVLSQPTKRVYAPNGTTISAAGARSAFMLPNIGCAIQHTNLHRDYNVQHSPPKSLYEHWALFKEIANSDAAQCEWRCCLLYFSESWIKKLHHDRGAGSRFKSYLHEVAWSRFEYHRNRFHYDIAFSIIQKTCNLKPNPYLVVPD